MCASGIFIKADSRRSRRSQRSVSRSSDKDKPGERSPVLHCPCLVQTEGVLPAFGRQLFRGLQNCKRFLGSDFARRPISLPAKLSLSWRPAVNFHGSETCPAPAPRNAGKSCGESGKNKLPSSDSSCAQPDAPRRSPRMLASRLASLFEAFFRARDYITVGSRVWLKSAEVTTIYLALASS